MARWADDLAGWKVPDGRARVIAKVACTIGTLDPGAVAELPALRFVRRWRLLDTVFAGVAVAAASAIGRACNALQLSDMALRVVRALGLALCLSIYIIFKKFPGRCAHCCLTIDTGAPMTLRVRFARLQRRWQAKVSIVLGRGATNWAFSARAVPAGSGRGSERMPREEIAVLAESFGAHIHAGC